MDQNSHIIICATCGAEIDRRDLSQVMSHGNWNEASHRHECEPEGKIVEFSAARRVGDSVEWTRDKKPINLN